jgi:cytoskeleton protein RodZ
MNSSETENVTRPDELTGAPGRLLGEARQSQNLSVADVARQLKLSLNQVEALEAGDYVKLPGPVFVRGFIRNYARLLKLDSEQLVNSASKRLPHDEERPAAPPSYDIPFPNVAPRRWPVYAAAIAAVLAALAAYEFYFSETQTAVTRPVAVPTPAPAAQPAVPESAPVAPAIGAGQVAPQTAPPGAGAAPGAQDAPPAAGRSGAQDPPPAAKGAMQHQESLPGRREREVRMVFDQESWVEIRDRSGKAIFSRLNRRGTEQRVNGQPPLAVVVGNSHGVRLTYDEQPVDLGRHTKIDVARFNLE